ncbi:HIT-type Zinc finger family protein [Hibiscus syriacus]|uniref:HIT-type Zinc finger family protein n=1 Tax=Hibiscus syriacus TaxID=106335 RepID=A0A6A2Y5V0_HIBSY|nr:zinc finger HIT domain-containing protein 3-like [Hibiscus syriacus]KAE8679660.1 HIT-type Zinc finger family protein [Hibiscus syriacus]
MGGPSRQYEVCNKAQSKYKFPSCLVPYCSLPCFKTHKETPSVKPKSTQEKSGTSSLNSGSVNDAVTITVKSESTVDAMTPNVKPELSEGRASGNPGFQVERKLEVDDPSEVLQIMQMQAIASSNEVREALKDEHLQKLISNIDSSPEALNELDKAMGVDVFRIFSDKILSTINPCPHMIFYKGH